MTREEPLGLKVGADEVEGGARRLRSPQFTLAFWFVGTSVLAAFLAIFQYLPLALNVAIVFLAIVIFAHVAGNAIGTTLNGHVGSPSHVRPRRRQQVPHSPPLLDPGVSATKLGKRTRLGVVVAALSLAGSLGGGAGGGWMLARANWHNLSAGSFTLGVISCGVLGGLFTFWLVSFSMIFFQAVKQAHEH